MQPIEVINGIVIEINKVDGRYKSRFGDIWDGAERRAFDHATMFVKEVEGKFRRKSKTYGFLKVNRSSTSIPSILKTFNQDIEVNFFEMAKSLSRRIIYALSESKGNPNTGHVVFIHYRNESEEEDLGRLLVVMVDKKDVFDFDEGLVPEQFKSIDVDTLRQAVLYDLTLFDSIYPDHVEENQSEAYLRFIKGKSKGVFFQEALGTDEIIDNTVSVYSMFDAVDKFGQSLQLKKHQIAKLNDEVEQLIHEKKGKQISITSVAKKVINNLPDKLVNYTVEDFVDFVNEKEFQISEVFDVTPGQLDKATTIEGKRGSDYSYRIKKSALGSHKENDKHIRYNPQSRMLYFEVDEEQHDALVKAISKSND